MVTIKVKAATKYSPNWSMSEMTSFVDILSLELVCSTMHRDYKGVEIAGTTGNTSSYTKF